MENLDYYIYSNNGICYIGDISDKIGFLSKIIKNEEKNDDGIMIVNKYILYFHSNFYGRIIYSRLNP